MIVVRLLWVFPAAYIPRMLSKCPMEDLAPLNKGLVVVGWTGLRGVVSLAAALSLPVETYGGLPFPYRSLILLQGFTFASADPLAGPGSRSFERRGELCSPASTPANGFTLRIAWEVYVNS